MVKHKFPIVTSIHHFAVVTKEVKERLEGPVNDINVDIIPEHFLFNTGFKQFLGDAEITDLTRFGKLFEDFLMVFSEIVEKGGTHAHHLANGHLDNPEEGLDGIVRLVDELMCLHLGLILVVYNHFPEQGIFILESLVDGSFGDTHFLCQ